MRPLERPGSARVPYKTFSRLFCHALLGVVDILNGMPQALELKREQIEGIDLR